MSSSAPSNALSGFVRSSLLLMVVGNIGTVANLLCTVALGWNLSKEEFGDFATASNLMIFMSLPLDAFRAAVSQTAALSVMEGRVGVVRTLARRWSVILLVAALVSAAACGLARHVLADYFKLQSGLLVVLTGLSIGLSLFTPLFTGLFQGLQRFGWMSAVGALTALLRLAAIYLFLKLISATASSGMAATVFSSAAVLAMAVLALRNILFHPGEHTGRILPFRYLLGATVMLASFAVLMLADVPAASRALDDVGAGTYSQLSKLAQAVVFLPGPIAIVLFPKVVSSGGMSRDSRRMLGRALLLMLAFMVPAMIACSLLPRVPLYLLYRISNPDPEMLALARLAPWVMAPLALTSMFVNFELAQRRFRCLPWIMLVAGTYFLCLRQWGSSPWAIFACLAGASGLSAAGFGLAIWRTKASG